MTLKIIAAVLFLILSLPAGAVSADLGDAVDNTSFTWSTGGDASWFYQTAISYSAGDDAAQSGPIGHNQSTWIETTVTGPGLFSFYSRVSSASSDYLIFYIDGVEQFSLSGEMAFWSAYSNSLGAGTHVLRWVYVKDGSESAGSDAAWLDKVLFDQSSLGEAVDNLNLPWVSGGNPRWFPQTTHFHYDGDAAESGNIGDNQSTWIEASVTGPGELSFYWKVSSESEADYLEFYIDGAKQDAISGEVDWTQSIYALADETHTLKWTYAKNASGYGGSDAGWLDKVVFISEGDTTSPTASFSINYGAAYTNIASVELFPSCSDASGCAEMMFSNDNLTWSLPEPYSSTTSWVLTSGQGSRTVYAGFSDYAGNWSDIVLSTIILDPEARLTRIMPAYYDFGPVGEDHYSETRVFTLTNKHGVTITLGDLAVLGPDKTDFTIVEDTCSGSTLGRDASCTFGVQFFPKDEIADSMLRIYKNALSLFTGIRSRAALEVSAGEGRLPGKLILRGEMTIPIYKRLMRPYRLSLPGLIPPQP